MASGQSNSPKRQALGRSDADRLGLVYESIKRWYNEPKMLEKGMECLLWMELFKGPLKYKKNNIEYQENAEEGEGKSIPDLKLCVSKNFKVPVEVKKPRLSDSAFKRGRNQVSVYALKMKTKFAILTDGSRWEILQINRSKKQYKVVWTHRIKRSKPSSLVFLKNLGVSKIETFTEFAGRVFGDIGLETILDKALAAALGGSLALKRYLIIRKVEAPPELYRLMIEHLKIYARYPNSDRPSLEWLNIIV